MGRIPMSREQHAKRGREIYKGIFLSLWLSTDLGMYERKLPKAREGTKRVVRQTIPE